MTTLAESIRDVSVAAANLREALRQTLIPTAEAVEAIIISGMAGYTLNKKKEEKPIAVFIPIGKVRKICL